MAKTKGSLLILSDAAKEIRRDPRTLRASIQRGTLPATKLNGSWYVDRKSLLKYDEERPTRTSSIQRKWKKLIKGGHPLPERPKGVVNRGAYAVWYDHAINGISMADIAAERGVSRQRIWQIIQEVDGYIGSAVE